MKFSLYTSSTWLIYFERGKSKAPFSENPSSILKYRDRAEGFLSSINKLPTSTATDGGISKKADKAALDTWDVAQRWIQSVSKEESTRKQWEQMYGWMADYDAKVFYSVVMDSDVTLIIS